MIEVYTKDYGNLTFNNEEELNVFHWKEIQTDSLENSKFKNISQPQYALFNRICNIFGSGGMEQEIITKEGKHYFIDIVIPHWKIGFEYDGWVHKYSNKKEDDVQREEELKKEGWIIIRFNKYNWKKIGWGNGLLSENYQMGKRMINLLQKINKKIEEKAEKFRENTLWIVSDNKEIIDEQIKANPDKKIIVSSDISQWISLIDDIKINNKYLADRKLPNPNWRYWAWRNSRRRW